MHTQVEELDGLQRRMTVQVPAENVAQEVQKRLVSLSRRARIDGFRPGKVPVKVLKRMYGAQVRQEVVGELLQSSFEDAVKEQSLRIAGAPRVEPITLKEGSPLEYRATFEVFPEFEPNGIDGLKVERPQVEINESDVDKMLENLREQRVEWRPVERPAAEKDQVKITFEGRVDGEPFPNGSGEDVPVVLGSNAMIPGFEDQLIGHAAAAEVTFDITFPDDYPEADMAGKQAQFTVKINAVAEPVLPQVDDEFAIQFGIKEGGLPALRQSLRDNMERELEEKIKAEVKRQVMEGLVERNDILVPQALVDDEIDNLARESRLPDLPDEQTDEQKAKYRELKTQLFGEAAQRRVKLGLIVSRLINARGIEVDENQVQTQLEKLAASYEDKDEFIGWYRQNPQAMSSLRTLVLEDQAVKWLLESAQVSDKAMSFDELMRPDGAANSPS